MRTRSTRYIAAAVLLGGLAWGSIPAHGAGKPQPTAHHIDMIYVTVMNTAVSTAINGGNYSYSPDDGNEFLTIKISAVNKNDVQLAVNSGDFTLLNPSGSSIDANSQTIGTPFNDTVLDPNGSTQGTITYQVPKRAHMATLRWSPQPSSSSERWPTASWVIHY